MSHVGTPGKRKLPGGFVLPIGVAVAAILGRSQAECGPIAGFPSLRAQLGQPCYGSHRFSQFAGHLDGQGLLNRVRVRVLPFRGMSALDMRGLSIVRDYQERCDGCEYVPYCVPLKW